MRAEPSLAPLAESGITEPDLAALRQKAASEKRLQCDAPKNSGWRPGARWARTNAAAPKGGTRRDVEMQIAALPLHQRPPMRMLGRASEPADHPFRAMPPDEAGASSRDQDRDRSSFHRTAGPGIDWAKQGARPSEELILVTSHKVGARVEVAAASPAARAQGIAPGMALTQVRASFPHAVVRDADAEGDAADLDRLALLLARRWTPGVAKSDPDALFLDLHGVAHLYGGEERFARRLLRLLGRAGISARVAVADTAGAAWALARFAGALVSICPARAQAGAIADLPVAALRLDEPVLALFRRLGIANVADVAALPRGPLARRFGATTALRLDQALGLAAEPLRLVVPVDAIEVVQRFAEPIASAEAIDHWLARLVPRMTAELTAAGQGARAILLIAERVDGRPQRLGIGLARASRDSAHILRLVRRRIEEIEPGFGIDALRFRVRRSEPLAPQPFDEALGQGPADLGALIDLLATRAVPVWRARPVESDVPERSVAHTAPLDDPPSARTREKPDDVRLLDKRAADHPWQGDRPRPARLLHPPERLEHVVAELPDQPPRRFTWRGRRHVVMRADGPERITGEWWRRSAERDAVRDYFQVEDEVGQRFWLFRRGDGERSATGDLSWYMHGRFG